ncbi:hypothetical protein [Phytohabitans suffuscus]|uniref:Type II toxin-antitoxin system RelE/ParE family toxin n=1 Tax=Phytohabitans suffuscus TaxID=624315 RepID=A0A6F8YEY1_9ACTN|nr:hypothetical protein [Phytohabitans suffuscus]BCB84694.1 hypothetical protein Psuf_020070 [Phytohabitans suffuscus]
MSAPPYNLHYTDEAEKILDDMAASAQYKAKLKKVRKTLRLLEQQGPRYPGLNSHRYESVPGPGGAELWESYVENNTPSAWRIWWIYGPDANSLTIVYIGPHP